MKNKLFFIILSIFLIVGMTSCKKKESGDPQPNTSNGSSSCFYSCIKSINTYIPLSSADGRDTLTLQHQSTSPISLPFPIKLFGRTFNSILYLSGNQICFFDSTYTYSPTETDDYMITIEYATQTGNSAGTYVYKNCLSWITEGNVGSRIFKIQFATPPGSSRDANTQFWLHETSGNIDIRYGLHTPVTFNYELGILHYNSHDFVEGTLLGGDINSPVVNCYSAYNMSDYDNNYVNSSSTILSETNGVQDGLTFSFTKVK
jgi:hypothetical protein